MNSVYYYILFSFAWYREYIICLISFSKFSDVLHAFTCTSPIGNFWKLWSVTLASQPKFKGRLLPFCCLLKSKIYSRISTPFFGFSSWGISLLLLEFLNSINPLLILFIIPSLLISSYKFLQNMMESGKKNNL